MDTKRSVGNDLHTAVLAARLVPDAPERVTLEGLLNEWLRRSLGLRSGRVTVAAVRAALLARELGLPSHTRPESVARLAAAKLAGARGATPNDIEHALVERWLTSTAGPKDGQADDLIEWLVPEVNALARNTRAKRFGSRKVFIASAWAELQSNPRVARLGLEGFKQALVEAHQRGALVLSRADLVAAMDPQDVAASETRHLNATYHFIQLGGES